MAGVVQAGVEGVGGRGWAGKAKSALGRRQRSLVARPLDGSFSWVLRASVRVGWCAHLSRCGGRPRVVRGGTKRGDGASAARTSSGRTLEPRSLSPRSRSMDWHCTARPPLDCSLLRQPTRSKSSDRATSPRSPPPPASTAARPHWHRLGHAVHACDWESYRGLGPSQAECESGRSCCDPTPPPRAVPSRPTRD